MYGVQCTVCSVHFELNIADELLLSLDITEYSTLKVVFKIRKKNMYGLTILESKYKYLCSTSVQQLKTGFVD